MNLQAIERPSDTTESDTSFSNSDLEFSNENNSTEAKAQKVLEILKKSRKKQTSLSTNPIFLYDKYCQHTQRKAVSFEDFTKERPLTSKTKSYQDSWLEFEDYRKVNHSNVTFMDFLATSNDQSENNPQRIASHAKYVQQNGIQHFISFTDYLNNFPEDDLETNLAFGIYLNDKSIPDNEKVQYWTWKKTWLRVCNCMPKVVQDITPPEDDSELVQRISERSIEEDNNENPHPQMDVNTDSETNDFKENSAESCINNREEELLEEQSDNSLYDDNLPIENVFKKASTKDATTEYENLEDKDIINLSDDSPSNISVTLEIPPKVEETIPLPKLTAPNYKRLSLKTPQEQQIQLIHENVEEKLVTLDIQKQIITLINCLVNNQHSTESFTNLLKSIEIKLEEQSQRAVNKIELLENSNKMAEHFKTKLKRPKVNNSITNYPKSTIKLLEPHNILKAIEPFNNDTCPNLDFSVTWQYILSYTRSLELNEQSFITILLLVTQGEAHKTIYDMSTNNKSLDDILDTMTTVFCKQRTIIDNIKDLHNFKRKASENIECSMGRAALLVEKIKPFYSETSWLENSERILTSILKQIVTKQTLSFIQKEELKLLQLGASIEYESLIDQVNTFEENHNQRPVMDISLKTNICSGLPIDFEIEQQNITQDKTKILEEKILQLENTILQIHSSADNELVENNQLTQDDEFIYPENVLHTLPTNRSKRNRHKNSTFSMNNIYDKRTNHFNNLHQFTQLENTNNEQYGKQCYKNDEDTSTITDIKYRKDGELNYLTIKDKTYYKCNTLDCKSIHEVNTVCDRTHKNHLNYQHFQQTLRLKM